MKRLLRIGAVERRKSYILVDKKFQESKLGRDLELVGQVDDSPVYGSTEIECLHISRG